MAEVEPGATLLEDEELAELIPGHLATQAALNAWEQANIAEAARWLRSRRHGKTVLRQPFLREVHRRMFNATWRWAGTYRVTGKNLGVPAAIITQSMSDLLTDVEYWCLHHTYTPQESAARFHHRLVTIHPFPHGNGRHARLVTDELLRQLRAKPFTWGAASLEVAHITRQRYLAALKAADQGEFEPLLAFVRS
jgi:Fic-DOC domain mobile mystery protein B